MRVVPVGDAAFRFSRPDGIPAPSLARALRAMPQVSDVVVTEHHVLVVLVAPIDDARVLANELSKALSSAAHDPAPLPRTHVVGVRYDGEDLASCASALGLEVAAVVRIHASRVYEVKMIGFLPGFAYLGDLDPALVLPRRSTPRTRVPAGSVAIADAYTAVYPFASPGGWHLLGRAIDFVPFAMESGDYVRFEARQ